MTTNKQVTYILGNGFTTFEFKCYNVCFVSLCETCKSLNSSKHSFSDLGQPQSNFVCPHDLISMMNIYQVCGHSFTLTLKEQWRQRTG